MKRLALSKNGLQTISHLIDEEILDRLMEVIVSHRICLNRYIVRDVVDSCASELKVYDRIKGFAEERLESCAAYGNIPPELVLRSTMIRFHGNDLAYVAKYLIKSAQVTLGDLYRNDWVNCPSLIRAFIDFCMNPRETVATTDLNIFAAILLARDNNRVFHEVIKILKIMGF